MPASAPPTPPRPTHTWILWLMLMLQFSLIVALITGILTSQAGARLAGAVMAGGGAFGATMGICLGAVAAVRELRRLTAAEN